MIMALREEINLKFKDIKSTVLIKSEFSRAYVFVRISINHTNGSEELVQCVSLRNINFEEYSLRIQEFSEWNANKVLKTKQTLRNLTIEEQQTVL